MSQGVSNQPEQNQAVQDRFEVTAFYCFADFPQYRQERSRLEILGRSLGLCGTILVAEEGINGTIAGKTQSDIEVLMTAIREIFPGLTRNDSVSVGVPFKRWFVKAKREIITIRRTEANPGLACGEHVSPRQWNEIISDPKTLILDTRNRYEVEEGTFKGAVDPEIDSFGEFPDYVETHLKGQEDRPVAMFCTGGIRCEKASAYMISQGFKNVYQLKGGILTYLRETAPEENLFEGECFVFDGRRKVNDDLLGSLPGEFDLADSPTESI